MKKVSSTTSLAPTDWLQAIISAHPEMPLELLKQSFSYATAHHQALAPYDINSLNLGMSMADELLNLQADPYLVSAALVFPSVQQFTLLHLDKHLDPAVSKLIIAAQAIAQIERTFDQAASSKADHADKLRKMLLAIIDDMRVVILKLVERLAILRALRSKEVALQQKTAHVVREIYAPLANRLGIGQIKWQLEDWSFRYLNPEAYQDIKKKLNMRRQDREAYVAHMLQHIQDLFEQSHIPIISVNGRAKHIYSIYRKITRKQVEFEEIYDAIALRILVPSLSDCYHALSLVHNHFEPIAKEFDDYIAHPKSNGYRSIHTAVVSPDKKSIEIQIRTPAMHEEAELGIAAHWAYKEGGHPNSVQTAKINWLREVMAWQQELSEKESTADLPNNLFADRIYVFTPQGDIIDLPEGSTPLDFAYHVHSDIGHRCRGAQVNGALVSLTHSLKTGDQVHIQTSKESKPSRDWLNPESAYLKTTRAKSKVTHWFRAQHFQQNWEKGQGIWEKAIKGKGLPRSPLTPEVCKHFNFKKPDALLAALGSGDLSVQAVLQQLQALDKAPLQPATTPLSSVTSSPNILKKKRPSSQSHVNIAGVDNLLTQLAKCCKPIPGDAIIGYITQGRGVNIHRKNCRNLHEILEKNPGRLIKANWGEENTHHYPVDLIIEAHEKHGLVRDVTHIIASEKISLLHIHSTHNPSSNHTLLQITIEVDSLDPLKQILQLIRQIPEVIRAERQL